MEEEEDAVEEEEEEAVEEGAVVEHERCAASTSFASSSTFMALRWKDSSKIELESPKSSHAEYQNSLIILCSPLDFCTSLISYTNKPGIVSPILVVNVVTVSGHCSSSALDGAVEYGGQYLSRLSERSEPIRSSS